MKDILILYIITRNDIKEIEGLLSRYKVVLSKSDLLILDSVIKFYNQYGSLPTHRYYSLDESEILSRQEAEDLLFRELNRRINEKFASDLQDMLISNLESPNLIDKVINYVSDISEIYSVNSESIFTSTDDDFSIEKIFWEREELNYYVNIPEIQGITGGLDSGTVTVIGGYVGSFKTTLACNMMLHNAFRGIKSAYCTLEGIPSILRIQLLSSYSSSPLWSGEGILYNAIRKNELPEEKKDYLKKIEASFNEKVYKYIKIFTPNELNIDFISSIKTILYYLIENGYSAFYLDHAQLLRYYYKKFNEMEIVNQIVKDISDVAVEARENGYDFRCVILSQIGREAYKKALRRDGRYDLSCLAQYSELERSASYVITLFSTEDLKSVNEIKCQLLKSRFSDTIEDPFSVFCDGRYFQVGSVSLADAVSPEKDSLMDILGDDDEIF